MFNYTIFNKNLEKVKSLFQVVPELKDYWESKENKGYNSNAYLVLQKTGLLQYALFIDFYFSYKYERDGVVYFPNKPDPNVTFELLKEKIKSGCYKWAKNIDSKKTPKQFSKLLNGKVNNKRYSYAVKSSLMQLAPFLYKYRIDPKDIDTDYQNLLSPYLVELQDNLFLHKEYDVNKDIIYKIVNSLSSVKDFRRLNSDFITESIRRELNKMMLSSIKDGDKVKPIKELKNFTKNKEYNVLARQVNYNGILEIKLSDDNDTPSFYEFSNFEEIKQLRLDKLNLL